MPNRGCRLETLSLKKQYIIIVRVAAVVTSLPNHDYPLRIEAVGDQPAGKTARYIQAMEAWRDTIELLDFRNNIRREIEENLVPTFGIFDDYFFNSAMKARMIVRWAYHLLRGLLECISPFCGKDSRTHLSILVR